MARGRMIDRVIVLSRKINAVSEGAENLYYRIYVSTDDFGLFHADPKILKGQIYTLRRISVATIEKRLNELIEIGLIKIYENNGEKYLEVAGFEKHQTFRKDYVRKYEFPKPDTKSYESVRTRTESPTNLNKSKLNKINSNILGHDERDREKESMDKFFDKEIWPFWPRKEQKGKAKEKFFALVNTHKINPQRLKNAVIGYLRVEKSKETKKWYLMYLKTFFYAGSKKRGIPGTWEEYEKYADPKYEIKPRL